MRYKPSLFQIGPTARYLRVSVDWLRGEAEAGRVPHLEAGDTLLFDPEAVEAALLDRARDRTQKGVADGQ